MKQNRDASFDFGRRIRSLRLERGMSQEELALNAGITPAYLGMVERGEKNPTLVTIEKLCGAIGITLEECFFQEQKPLKPDLISRQILSVLDTMDPQEKSIVLQVIEQLLQMRELGEQSAREHSEKTK